MTFQRVAYLKSLDVDGISFTSKYLKKKTIKKVYTYMAYLRPYQQNSIRDNWGRKEFEWTRNKIFKLYSDARFYN